MQIVRTELASATAPTDVRGAVDLLMDLQPGTDELSSWLVRVRDENGKIVCTLDVQEAEAARKTSQ
jgi:hypothetical protein